jgi:hypothetical protein
MKINVRKGKKTTSFLFIPTMNITSICFNESLGNPGEFGPKSWAGGVKSVSKSHAKVFKLHA